MSDVTKKYSRLSLLFGCLSFILTAMPIIVYMIIAFCNSHVEQKVTLGCTVVIALLLTIVNVIMKYHIRSTLWILVLGIYYCINDIMPLLLMVAIGTILDEFIISPLHKTFKNKKSINNEIDKRIINHE